MPNPFDGSSLPPVYSPKTAVVGGIVYKLDPSGYFWDAVGVSVPPGNEPPSSVAAPAALMEYVRTASPVDTGAIAIASAASVQRQNENYNKLLFERFLDALVAFSTGKGAPVPSVAGKYRIADFPTLYMFIRDGIDTTMFNPPEVVFNQR